MSQAKQTLLVLRAQSGDREALDLLLRELQYPLFRQPAGRCWPCTISRS